MRYRIIVQLNDAGPGDLRDIRGEVMDAVEGVSHGWDPGDIEVLVLQESGDQWFPVEEDE